MNNYTRKQVVIFSLSFLVLGVVLGIALHSHAATKTALGRALPFLDPGANPMLQDVSAYIAGAKIVSVDQNQIEVKDSAGRQGRFPLAPNVHVNEASDPAAIEFSRLKTGDTVSLQLEQQGFLFRVAYIILFPLNAEISATAQ